MTLKDGHFTTARPKPFVVSNITTKRYAPTISKLPVQRQPLRTSIREAKQTSRHTWLPTVAIKVEPRTPLPKSTPMSAPNKASKVHKSQPSADRSLPEKTLVPRPPKIMQRLKEGMLIGRYPTSLRSTQVATANQLPPRPSCVPRSRTSESSVDALAASKGEQDVTINIFTTGLHNLGVARPKPSVTAKTGSRAKVTETSFKKPVRAANCHKGTPTWNRRLTPPKTVAYPRAVNTASHVAWSPPQSPDLSSFPSQSWTIVVDVDVKQIKAPTKICGDKSLSSFCGAPRSGVVCLPKDLGRRPESVSPSPTLSSPTIIVETPTSPAEPIVGSDGAVKISTPTKEPSTKVSHMIGAATIISPSRDGITSSMASLAKVIDRSQASPPTGISDNRNRPQRTISSVLEIARTMFSPSRRTSQSADETAASKTMGTNVSRIRKLFISSLDKDAKVSKNPMTQIEIEMLRARRRVAGGGVVNPRLDRLGSLTAIAIVTKFGMSSSDSPGRV